MTSLAAMNIDWNQVEEVGFKPLPEGEYAAKISGTKFAPPKDGNGMMLTVTLTLLGGKGVKNRKVSDYFILKHDNGDKEMDGRGKYKRFITSIGRDPSDFNDFSDLQDIILGVVLKVTPGNDKYGPGNNVKKYIPFNEDLLNTDNNNSQF